jgi:hypothetical protein
MILQKLTHQIYSSLKNNKMYVKMNRKVIKKRYLVNKNKKTIKTMKLINKLIKHQNQINKKENREKKN